ncbi:MAG: glycine cleavage system protein H, partial [Actinomycetota bacterium]|nr:glycine cleavage system protein H [Actinomycetota bacterium]
VTEGQPLGEVESTKSVSDVFSPVTGTVVAKNPEVEKNPELINNDPYGDGWLVAVDAEGVDLSALLAADDYRRLVEGDGA